MNRNDYIDIVFDGPPSAMSGRFVEVENPVGESVSVGEWLDRGNGVWALRIPTPPPLPARPLIHRQLTIDLNSHWTDGQWEQFVRDLTAELEQIVCDESAFCDDDYYMLSIADTTTNEGLLR